MPDCGVFVRFEPLGDCFITPDVKHARHWQEVYVLRVIALSILAVSFVLTVLSRLATLVFLFVAFEDP